MRSGYVLVWRRLFDHPKGHPLHDCARVGWWVYLLTIAAFRPRTYNGIALDRGEFIAGYSRLARRFGCSKQSVQRWFDALQDAGALTKRRVDGNTFVWRVVNWDHYQAAIPQTAGNTRPFGTFADDDGDSRYPRPRMVADILKDRGPH